MREWDLQFEGPVVEWRGPAPFYFVAIPAEESADIKFAAKGLEYWGQVPVVVRIGEIEFTTALFPRERNYFLLVEGRGPQLGGPAPKAPSSRRCRSSVRADR